MKVFKYRGGDSLIFKRDLNSLVGNTFWASNIDTLNDPCEGFVSTSWLIELIGLFHDSDEVSKLKGALNKSLSTRNNFGIYSLSTDPTDELLWAHYGNSHQGFCIEYELDLLIQGLINETDWLKSTGRINNTFHFEIKYTDQVPEMNPYDMSSINDKINYIEKLYGWKSKRWEYEKELRIISPTIGAQSYNQSSVKAIHFGLRMNDNQKKEVMQSLKGRDITYYQLELEGSSYELHSVLL